MSKDAYKRFERELTKTFYHIWILMNISVIYGQIFDSDFLTDYTFFDFTTSLHARVSNSAALYNGPASKALQRSETFE